MYDLNHLRQREFPHSAEHVYLHHAGISPLPQSVKTAVIQAAEGLANNPGQFFGDTLMDTYDQFRADAAVLINAAEPAEIVRVTTTSLAINAVAQAIAWEPGDSIAFCEVEFPSNAYPWLSLERDGVAIKTATAVNGGLTLAELEKVVDANTRLVAASAIQFLSGHRTDLQAIGNFCHERGILFAVDAIQAIGHMPIDVQAMHIDILATGGQKSLLAPPGTGFLYVRREVAEQMQPRQIGANSTVEFLHWLDYDMTPLPGADRFDMGTPNVTGVMAMAASVKLLQSLGIEHIDAHTRRLTAVAAQHLTELGFAVLTPVASGDYGPICTFATGLSSEETDDLVSRLARRSITVCKHLDAPGNAYIRVSFHAYNTEAEVAQFMAALKAEMEKSAVETR